MDRPNILLLLTDQQRADSIACSHADADLRASLRTPNLDRLCAEGCRFDRGYTPNPVCIPARHNLISGLPARYHGHPDNASVPAPYDLPMLPQILSDAGYRTHAVGKMHYRPSRRHHGFDRMEIMEETPSNRDEDDYLMYLKSVGCRVRHQHGVRHLLYHQPQRSLVPEEHHGSKWVADRSIDFLRRTHHRKQPFFLKASWIAPHPPENVPARLADLYAGKPLPARIPRVDPRADRSDLIPAVRAQFELGEGMLDDLPRLRRHMEHYHASISFVDEQVGRILQELDALGLADNTLVLFTSDHGEMLGDLDCFQKSAPYESASHVPFILRFPGRVQPGSVDREHFVDLNDFLPTCLDVAQARYPGPLELPGSSLLQLDRGRDRSIQYIENGRGPKRWCMLRDQRYKYVYSYFGGYEAFFDLQTDPGEQHNRMLTGLPAELAPEYQRLRQGLLKMEARWGLPGGVEWNDFMKYQPYEIKMGRHARNKQLPPWPANLPAADQAQLNDVYEEVLAAVQDEPAVRLHKLDLDSWQQNCNIPQAVLDRIRWEKR